jgi:hypothetical protein
VAAGRHPGRGDRQSIQKRACGLTELFAKFRARENPALWRRDFHTIFGAHPPTAAETLFAYRGGGTASVTSLRGRSGQAYPGQCSSQILESFATVQGVVWTTSVSPRHAHLFQWKLRKSIPTGHQWRLQGSCRYRSEPPKISGRVLWENMLGLAFLRRKAPLRTSLPKREYVMPSRWGRWMVQPSYTPLRTSLPEREYVMPSTWGRWMVQHPQLTLRESGGGQN